MKPPCRLVAQMTKATSASIIIVEGRVCISGQYISDQRSELSKGCVTELNGRLGKFPVVVFAGTGEHEGVLGLPARVDGAIGAARGVISAEREGEIS